MTLSISDLIIRDSNKDSEKYGGLAIASPDAWEVFFCFDQSELLDAITYYENKLTVEEKAKYEKMVKESSLPKFLDKDPVMIDGWAGYLLAKSLKAYHTAIKQAFSPNSNWPICSEYSRTTVSTLYSGMLEEDLYDPEHVDLFNILFAISDGITNVVYIANSREQYDQVMANFTECGSKEVEAISESIGDILLPETSESPLILLVGGIADSICPSVVYYNHMIAETRTWANSPWRSSFETLPNGNVIPLS